MPNKIIKKKHDEISSYYVNKLATISKEYAIELELTPEIIPLPELHPTVIEYSMKLNIKTGDTFEEVGHFTISDDITFFSGSPWAPPPSRNLTIYVEDEAPKLQGNGLSKMLMYYNCVNYAKNTNIRSFDLMHVGADSSAGFWDQFMEETRYYPHYPHLRPNPGRPNKIGKGQEKECTFFRLCQYCGADKVIEFVDGRVSRGVLGGRKTKKRHKSKKKKTKKKV